VISSLLALNNLTEYQLRTNQLADRRVSDFSKRVFNLVCDMVQTNEEIVDIFFMIRFMKAITNCKFNPAGPDKEKKQIVLDIFNNKFKDP